MYVCFSRYLCACVCVCVLHLYAPKICVYPFLLSSISFFIKKNETKISVKVKTKENSVFSLFQRMEIHTQSCRHAPINWDRVISWQLIGQLKVLNNTNELHSNKTNREVFAWASLLPWWIQMLKVNTSFSFWPIFSYWNGW